MGDDEPGRGEAIQLRTDRLRISALTAADVAAFVAYRRDPRVARFQSWDVDYDSVRAERLVAGQSTGALIRGQWLQLGLHDFATGELVGDVAVYSMPDQPDSYELGVTLAHRHQSRGLANEACKRVLDFLFSTAGAHRVQASCDVRNTASRRLLHRLGLRHESRLVDADWCKGEWTSVDTFAMLAAERERGDVRDPDRVLGLSFLGVHTSSFAAMRDLYANVYGAPMINEAPGVAWFGAADGAELHVYAADDDYHQFFGTAPVPGILVEDFVEAQSRLTAYGVEWLTEPDKAAGRIWRHYRAPDGNVYEVMGPDPQSTSHGGTRD